MVPLVPGALADGSPAPLVGLPAESILVLFLLVLVPWPPVRVVVAAGFGVTIVVAVVLAGIDAGYESVLDIHFDPLDWQQLGDAFGVVQGSIGGAAASRLVVLLALAAAGLIVALSWAALRAGAAVRSDRGHGTIALSHGHRGMDHRRPDGVPAGGGSAGRGGRLSPRDHLVSLARRRRARRDGRPVATDRDGPLP